MVPLMHEFVDLDLSVAVAKCCTVYLPIRLSSRLLFGKAQGKQIAVTRGYSGKYVADKLM